MRPLAFTLLLPLAAPLGGCGIEFAAGALAGGVTGHEIAERSDAAEPAKTTPEKPVPEKAAAEKAPAEKPAPAKTAAAVPIPRPLPPQRREAAPAAEGSSVSPEHRRMFEDFMKSRNEEQPER
jgi:hypothetical protein